MLHPLTPRAVRGVSAIAALALLAVAPAGATIIPARGMAGVALRMSETQVRARLGTPLRITRTRGALGFLVTRLHYPRVEIDLQSLSNRPIVIRVLTTKPGETTVSGVGVGSPLAAVQRLHGAHCWRNAGARYCGIGDRKPLHPFTLFWISATARVTLVEVSLNVNS